MIKATVKNNIRFPNNLLIVDDLLFIGDRIIIPTIQLNIDREVSLDGSRLPALEESTVAYKRRNGLSEKILTATGRLRSCFFAKKKNSSTVIVSLAQDRKDIGEYLQIDGVGKKNKKFNFFGISEIMERSAIKYMKDRIKNRIRELRNAK